ncbi:hypothetical protein BEP19_16310 [Ammoniphilus oxalaticus]|uniref:Uncharacterized protein n=1 Tax=Ammoniphilus oxalaticus TaxID=66863 RepID=A0A419SQK2_9BACL|nr:hypothetical protein [Ammoniphilus oxalaticus]RKD26762.1 hypothetical protein BEP19_16310 [Ammoniphilus oxalaticus]
MDVEISHWIEQAKLEQEEEKDQWRLICQTPTAADYFKRLLDGATQAALDFTGGEWEGQAVIGFQLKNANGEFYLALQKKDWTLLDEQPDHICFVYGDKEQERFELPFLNRMFEAYLDQIIKQYNEGDQALLTREIVSVFAEEE